MNRTAVASCSMHRAFVATAACCAALVLASGTSALASVGVSVRAPVEYRSWTTTSAGSGERTIRQMYAPLITTLRFTPQLDCVIGMGFHSSETDSSGSSTQLNGATDISLQGFYRPLGERLLILGGVNLPTGERELSREELLLTSRLSHPLLGMRLRQPGKGLDWNGGLAWSLPLNDRSRLGLGAGVLLPGSYSFVDQEPEFEPTPQGSVSLGLQFGKRDEETSTGQLGLQATYRVYANDQLGGKDAFAEGDQVELTLQARRTFDRVRTLLFAQGITKQKNEAYVESAENLTVRESEPGTWASMRLSFAYAFAPRIEAGIDGDWKHLNGSDLEGRNGDVIGGGPTFAFGLAGGHWLRFRGTYSTGSAGEGPSSIDLTGFGALLSFIWRAGL